MDSIWLLIIATIGSFFAGFMDAVVGGGGLMQIPLLFILFPTIPHTQLIASNRFASMVGTAVAAKEYLKTITINYKALAWAACFVIIAAFGGAFIMQLINTTVFKPILLFIIVGLVIYMIFKKDVGLVEKPKYKNKKLYVAMALIGIALGLYNGIIGPGTGTLLVFSLVHFVGFSFIQASGYAKVINALADAASVVAFFIQGAVILKLALPLLVTNVLGSYVGSKMAIKKGNEFIRIFFIVVLLVLIIRFAWDVFGKH
jgi:uncharacterized membrane protein YfcA